MILVPILGIPEQSRAIIEQSLRSDISPEQLDKVVSTLSLSTTLSSIQKTNVQLGQLGTFEEILNIFVTRASSVSDAVYRNLDTPAVALQLWRGLFEVTVVFQVLTQTLTRGGNKDLFLELLARFRDYGLISGYKRSRSVPAEILKLERAYRDLPKHKILELEYDWLNPAFPERVSRRFSKRYHPSFRDLVQRTRESGHTLSGLLSDYEDASGLLHFGYGSVSLAESVTGERVRDVTTLTLQVFLYDYFDLVSKLYPETSMSKVATVFRDSIRRCV